MVRKNSLGSSSNKIPDLTFYEQIYDSYNKAGSSFYTQTVIPIELAKLYKYIKFSVSNGSNANFSIQLNSRSISNNTIYNINQSIAINYKITVSAISGASGGSTAYVNAYIYLTN